MAEEKNTTKAAQSAAPKGSQNAAKLDNAGNPVGTTYTQEGKAVLPEGSTATPVNLPQNADNSLMYNEDGTVFSIPADSDKTLATMKADISGLALAISKGEQKLKTAEEMAAEAEDSDKPIFEKNIASQRAAIESNKAAKATKEQEYENFRLSLITPSQRATERELAQAYRDRDAILEKIKDLEAKKKAWSVGSDVKSATSGGSSIATPATEEQKKNREEAIAKYGTQGKAIVAFVKQGWTNTEIYKHLGIPPASVPGPKNAWLNSPEGQTFTKENPGVVK